jgi:hypothetical protein
MPSQRTGRRKTFPWPKPAFEDTAGNKLLNSRLQGSGLSGVQKEAVE